MKALIKRLLVAEFPPAVVPLFLLGLCLLAYAPMIPYLGYFWDEWAFTWIFDRLGTDGLTRYFATNRPFWGMIYKATLSILGVEHPWVWQVFAILMRAAGGMGLWWALRIALPRRAEAAVWAAAFFVLYPGFGQQSIALMYSHFFIVLAAYTFSLVFSLLALKQPRQRWLWMLLALACSLVNLLSMEYFYILELARPVLMWAVIQQEQSSNLNRRPVMRVLLAWLPYFMVLAGVVAWRAFIFGYHTYQPTVLNDLRSQPLAALGRLLPLVINSLWVAGPGAWIQAFSLPDIAQVGIRTTLYYTGVALAGLFFALFMLLRQGDTSPSRRRDAGWLLLAGAITFFTAGAPFWVTNLEILLAYPNNRFTLPFMFGSSLLLGGLLLLLPGPRWLRGAVAAVLVAAAIGWQFQVAVTFRRDWNYQKAFFWQMSWRIPGLEPGTTVLINESPIRYASDNSLTAPLNWIYAPENTSQEMSYMMYYPTVRLGGGLPGLERGLPIRQDYLAARFNGNTSQVIALYFNPPGCLRLLDPALDAGNITIPAYLRAALPLVSRDAVRVNPAEGRRKPMTSIFGSEPGRSWCYYFEQADLARQQKHWDEVIALAEKAFHSGDAPNDPVERIPFIEGYAHTGDWQRASELTREMLAVSPLVYQPVACPLWQRLAQETPPSAAKSAALAKMQVELECK
ncbi:MAG TPA: hypothetical protein VIO61_16630 [Anaerolineaceae bacterium]